MAGPHRLSGAKIRRNAQSYFAETAQRDTQLRQEQEKAKAADVAKTAKLRALRLAKEAADKEAAGNEAGRPPLREARRSAKN